MKYLKSFIINEKSGDIFDSGTFKDIMLELTDSSVGFDEFEGIFTITFDTEHQD